MTMTSITENTSTINKNQPRWLIATAGLALFWVIFLWNFWERGIYALGINATVFLVLVLALFLQSLHATRRLAVCDLFWIAPFIIIAASYALYDNQFWKITSLIVVPVIFVVFYVQAFTPANTRWTLTFFGRIAVHCFSIIKYFGTVSEGYISLVAPNKATRRRMLIRIIIGLTILIIISVTVIIPLLASADTAFKTAVDTVYQWLQKFISLSFWYRALVFIILSLLFAAALFAWNQLFKTKETKDTVQLLDPIISGIVLGGILVLYLLFLGIQFNHLWIGKLPFDFRETEQLVKSGFWQLLFLSVLNIVIYFFVYKKTVPAVQYVLTAFTGASLLLLASAGYRMGLYVTYYGLSYEKFFASYAVLYCAILFAWLITKLFAHTPADILKFITLLFLWMYALVAISPVEQFILRTNVALAKRPDSRIRLFEMTMLSSDVLKTVKYYNQTGRLQENTSYLAQKDQSFDWQPWIERQEQQIKDKSWYEYNLMNILSRSGKY